MLNMYSAADAIAEENEGVRKQTRVLRSSGKGIHSRYCAKGNRVAKTTASGRFEEMESEVAVRERRDLVGFADDFRIFMEEPKRIGIQTFVVAPFRAEDKVEPARREKLPTVRVFKTRPNGRGYYPRPAYVFND